MKFVLQSLVCLCLFAVGAAAQPATAEKAEAVRARYESAQAYERASDWLSAEREWRKVIELQPDDARVWVNLGVALNRQSKWQEAIDVWTKASVLDPKLAGAHFNLGLALVRRSEFAAAIKPLKIALVLEATREIARLLAHQPRDATLLEMAAQSLMRQTRYAEATIVLKRRLDLGSETSQLWAQYGDALDGAKRTPEALEAYRHAVDLAPDSISTRYGLGYLYWKQYRYDEAERELTEVLRRDPNLARAAFTLGDLYLTKGDAKRALPFLEMAARDYPAEFDTRLALGRALLLTGESKRGIEELSAAVKLDDSISDGHFQLGRALMQTGSREEGKRELDRARKLQDAQRAAERERFGKKP